MVEALAAVMPRANAAFEMQDVTIDGPAAGEVLLDITGVGYRGKPCKRSNWRARLESNQRPQD